MEYFWLLGGLSLFLLGIVVYLRISQHGESTSKEGVTTTKRHNANRRRKKVEKKVEEKKKPIDLVDDLQASLQKAMKESAGEEEITVDVEDVKLTRAERTKLQEVNSKLYHQYIEVKNQLKKTKLEQRRRLLSKNSFAVVELEDSESEDELRHIRKLPITYTAEALKKAIVDMQLRLAEALKGNKTEETEQKETRPQRTRGKAQDGEWQAVGASSQSAKKKKPVARTAPRKSGYNPDEWEFESVKAPVVDHGGFVWDDEPNQASAGKRKANKKPAQTIPGLVYI